jgi:hypothetical protein
VTRRVLAWLLIVTPVLLCGALVAIVINGAAMTGSGGIGAVSAGLPELVLELIVGVFVLLVSHLVTWQLTNFSTARRTGKAIWCGHAIATLAACVVGFTVAFAAAAILLALIQFLFITAAVALSLAHPRNERLDIDQ